GIRGPSIIGPRTRLQGFFVWDLLDFVINATLFVLIGLQLRSIIDGLSGQDVGSLVGYALVVSAVVVGVRVAWSLGVAHIIRWIDRRPSPAARRSSWRVRFVIGWSGMRGAVSLAAALAIPLTTDAGGPFPDRDLILFLTFVVIFTTLVLQGLSLPWVI